MLAVVLSRPDSRRQRLRLGAALVLTVGALALAVMLPDLVWNWSHAPAIPEIGFEVNLPATVTASMPLRAVCPG